MYASENGHEGCLRLLIATGASVEQKDKVHERNREIYERVG